jgi:hypothetical protein
MATVGALGHPGNELSNPYRTRVLCPLDLCPPHRFQCKQAAFDETRAKNHAQGAGLD